MNSNRSSSNTNLASNKTAFYGEQSRIFSNPYLIGLVLIIALGFIGYVFYYNFYTKPAFKIESNSSFYGKDLINYEPLFQSEAATIQDCIDSCNNDILCDGITYNNTTQICVGTKNGEIRNETADLSAWVKPNPPLDPTITDFKKAILVGSTNNYRVIQANKLSNPYMLGNFAYSFNLIIKDFYKNYGYWRHIFHKGTATNQGETLQYQSWENLIKDIPKQSIGVWVAPFTNNLRVAITTTSLANVARGSYADAYVQHCNPEGECYISDLPSGKWADKNAAGDGTPPKTRLDTFIEYVDSDLQNIPVNTKINITVNLNGRNVEIYINGKIVKIAQLEGTPQFDKTNLYVMQNYNIGGEISNLLYYPDTLKLKEIKAIMDLSDLSN